MPQDPHDVGLRTPVDLADPYLPVVGLDLHHDLSGCRVGLEDIQNGRAAARRSDAPGCRRSTSSRARRLLHPV